MDAAPLHQKNRPLVLRSKAQHQVEGRSHHATSSPATKSYSQPPPSKRSTTPGCRRRPDQGNKSFRHSSRRRRKGEDPPQSLQEGDRRQRRRLWGSCRASQGFPPKPHPHARSARPAIGDAEAAAKDRCQHGSGQIETGADLLHGAENPRGGGGARRTAGPPASNRRSPPPASASPRAPPRRADPGHQQHHRTPGSPEGAERAAGAGERTPISTCTHPPSRGRSITRDSRASIQQWISASTARTRVLAHADVQPASVPTRSRRRRERKPRRRRRPHGFHPAASSGGGATAGGSKRSGGARVRLGTPEPPWARRRGLKKNTPESIRPQIPHTLSLL